ncbi:conserved exported hypothetical protein [Arthrobacter sp. 9V]|uniref:hypothetical protein n=1 Tax=Arthrobacter sp. 9V TaxID=2653132 RepID=UPI0012F00D33|nr:hypothetical protein [Arthrobacter sp. 9V]VXC25582.1 conserved exported hypothetical protein [Arthrobacter sp. 9V]
MNVRRMRFVAVGVGAGVVGGVVIGEADDVGTSPPTARAPFGPGTSGEAAAPVGVCAGVELPAALQAVRPASTDAPTTPKTARRLGVEEGTAEWPPNMVVPQRLKK